MEGLDQRLLHYGLVHLMDNSRFIPVEQYIWKLDTFKWMPARIRQDTYQLSPNVSGGRSHLILYPI